MRTLLAFLLLCSSACAQLAAPLNDAKCLYRAQNCNPIPNEGTLSGVNLSLLSPGPTFVSDVLGDYLHFVNGNKATAPVPLSVLNSPQGITVAVRYRPEGGFASRALIAWATPAETPMKGLFLTLDTGNKYLCRFFASNNSAIPAQGTVNTSLNRTDTIVAQFDSPTKTNRLWVNGVNEATAVSTLDRYMVNTPVLQVPMTAGTIPVLGKVFAIAVWDRNLSPQEITDLNINADWLSGGSPPPPPPTYTVKVYVNGTLQPAGTSVKVDGVTLTPNANGDKVVEVENP